MASHRRAGAYPKRKAAREAIQKVRSNLASPHHIHKNLDRRRAILTGYGLRAQSKLRPVRAHHTPVYELYASHGAAPTPRHRVAGERLDSEHTLQALRMERLLPNIYRRQDAPTTGVPAPRHAIITGLQAARGLPDLVDDSIERVIRDARSDYLRAGYSGEQIARIMRPQAHYVRNVLRQPVPRSRFFGN